MRKILVRCALMTALIISNGNNGFSQIESKPDVNTNSKQKRRFSLEEEKKERMRFSLIPPKNHIAILIFLTQKDFDKTSDFIMDTFSDYLLGLYPEIASEETPYIGNFGNLETRKIIIKILRKVGGDMSKKNGQETIAYLQDIMNKHKMNIKDSWIFIVNDKGNIIEGVLY